MMINWFKSKFGKKIIATDLNYCFINQFKFYNVAKTPEPMPSLFPSVAKSSKLDFDKFAKSSFDKSRRWLYDMGEI